MHVYWLLIALFAGALFCSTASISPGAETRKMSLRECMELALNRNLDLQLQKISSEISGYSLQGAYGAYSPVFSVRAQRDFVSQPANFDPQKNNPDYPYELKEDRLSSTLGGSLPFGLSYDLTALHNARDATTDFSSDPDAFALWPDGTRETNNYYAEARLSARQPLLRDFWYNEDRLAIVLARKDQQISHQAVRMQLLRTVLSLELAYYDLVAARESVRVAEKSRELKQTLLREIRRRVEVGDLPPLDVDQAEAEYQNSITALSIARERSGSAENLLKSLITDDFIAWADIGVEPGDLLVATPPFLNRSESFQQALKNRPDLAEARLTIQKSDAVVQFRMNQLFPALDLVGQYGGLGVSPQSSTAFNDAVRFQDPVYYYGIVLSMPLSNVRQKSDYRTSKAQRSMAELQLKKAEQSVMVLVADWVNRVDSRYATVASTRSARQFAEAALRNEERKLQNGLSTSFFVLDFQERLIAAQYAEIQALTDYNKALAQLSFAEAKSLDRYGISVQF